MATLEGKWDCSQCRTVGIPGLKTACPNCGDARNQHLDPEEAPYLPDDARVITDQTELENANSGPSWNCGRCGTENRGGINTCVSCLEPRNHDDMVAGTYTYVSGVDAHGKELSDAEMLIEDRTDAILQSADKLQQLEDVPVAMPARTFHASALPRRGVLAVRDAARQSRVVMESRWGSKAALIFIGGLALLLVAALGTTAYALFFKTHDVTLTVQDLDWERQVEVEEYRTLTREDWSVPSDGRLQRSYQAVHHYRDVYVRTDRKSRQVPVTKQTGTRSEQYACGSTTVNNGNGTFSQNTTYCTRSVPVYTTTYETEYYNEDVYREEPVYQTKYVFEIDRWVTDYFEKAGTGEKPYWPKPTGLAELQRVGDERVETYEVDLVDEEKREFTRDLDLDLWLLLEVGETVAAKQTRQGSVRDITWPSS